MFDYPPQYWEYHTMLLADFLGELPRLVGEKDKEKGDGVCMRTLTYLCAQTGANDDAYTLAWGYVGTLDGDDDVIIGQMTST